MSEINKQPGDPERSVIIRNSKVATGALGLVVIGLILLTGLLGGSGPVKAQGATVTLGLTPLTLPVNGAGFVDVMIGEFTSIGGLGAYSLVIDYDAAVVTVSGVEEGDPPFAGGLPDVGNEDGGAPFTSIDNSAGVVRLLAFQAAQLPGPTGNIRVARINLQAVGQPGDTSDLTFGAVDLVDAESGESVPVTPASGSVEIVDGTSDGVSGRTTLQFRTSTAGRASVEISCPSLTTSVVPADDGRWEFSGVPAEECQLTATAPGYLTAQGPITVGDSPVVLPANQLLGGDANGDGFVALNDITGMIGQFTQSTENCEIDGNVFDVNCDGVVALNDITSAISNFARGIQPFPTQ
jgi:hypothetical protein